MPNSIRQSLLQEAGEKLEDALKDRQAWAKDHLASAIFGS